MALWLIFSFAVFLSGLAVALNATVGHAISAPVWLRDEITARLSKALPNMEVAFGDVSLVVSEDYIPRVAVRDVAVSTGQGGSIFEMTQLSAQLSARALLRGQLALTEAELSGAFVTLRRDASGRLGLSFGDALPTEGSLPDIPTLIAGFDRALGRAQLGSLDRIEATGMTVRYEDARARRAWTVDGGRMVLTRNDTQVDLRGDFAVLGGGANVATLEVSASSPIGQSGASFGFVLANMPSEDIGSQAAALAWLESLRAPISGSLRAEMFEDGALGPLNATLRIGKGVLQPNRETRPVPFEGAHTYFTYDPHDTTLRFAEVFVDSPWGRVTAEGQAVLSEMDSGLPKEMIGQFRLSGIEIKAEGFLEKPVTLSNAEMDMRLRLSPFRFTLGRLYVDDELLEARFKGDLRALRNGWDASLDAELDHATPETVLSFWPVDQKVRARDWVETRVEAGRLVNAALAIRSAPDTKPVVYLDAGIEKATLRYSNKFPPLEEASGRLTIIDNRLVAMIEDGVIKAGGASVDVAGSSVILPDIRIKQGPAQVNVVASGPIEAGLHYLESEPLHVMTKAGLSPDLGTGRFDLAGTVDFNMLRKMTPADFSWDMTAKLLDVKTERLIPSKVLAAEELTVRANREQVTISGRSTFNGVPVTGEWVQPLGTPGVASVLSADVPLSLASLAKMNISLPKDLISGQTTGRMTVTIPKGSPPKFSLRSDLAGLGAQIPQIGWAFGQKATGELRIDGQMSAPISIDTISLNAGTMRAEGTLKIKDDGQLDRLSLSRVRIGGWIDAPVDLIGRGAGRAPAVVVSGGTIDMRNANLSETRQGGSGTGAGGPIDLRLDRLQLSEGIALRSFRAAFQSGGGMSGTFTGKVNGDTAIKGEVLPQKNGSAFRLTSEDAGGVLRSAGFFKTARGGAMSLTLTPTGAEGTYDGALEVGKIRLRDAPAIGSLLDAISIVGLIDQLEGPGILFTEVEAQFRLTPSQLILTQSSAVGPSMGVSLDGYYDLVNSRFDMQGVLSPIYVLNGVGQVFSRKGEGLFGFNFTVKGSADAPQVGVNPLSVLTPGMFREIFRRPPPKLTQ